MVVTVRSDAQSLILVLLGGALLRISFGDAYLRYVKASMQPYLIAAGALLILLGVAAFVTDLRRQRHRSGLGDDDGDGAAAAPHGAGHTHGGPRVAWLLVLPVLAIFIVAPPPLGSYAAERGAPEIAEPESSNYDGLPPNDEGQGHVTLTVFQYWQRVVWDDGRSLGGRSIGLLGFVTPAEDGNGYFVSRMQIACCAADALPFSIRIITDQPAPPTDSWLFVVGSYTPNPFAAQDGERMPAIDADEVIPTQAPVDPYA